MGYEQNGISLYNNFWEQKKTWLNKSVLLFRQIKGIYVI